MNRSPDRNTFQVNAYIERCQADGVEPREDYINMYKQETEMDLEFEQDTEQHKNNLEYDLRTTPWICNKAKASEIYAQNIYAALCNQSWKRNDVWPLLKGESWSCSWRYAGGIVADMVEQGDYIDWYCSGIRDRDSPDNGFVSESVVTEEIREDFFRLGWIPVEDSGAD